MRVAVVKNRTNERWEVREGDEKIDDYATQPAAFKAAKRHAFLAWMGIEEVIT